MSARKRGWPAGAAVARLTKSRNVVEIVGVPNPLLVAVWAPSGWSGMGEGRYSYCHLWEITDASPLARNLLAAGGAR